MERQQRGAWRASCEYAPGVEAAALQSLASTLFAASLFPYLAFLFFLQKAKGPKLMNFGFAFLLGFVFATIPAGIYGACLLAVCGMRRRSHGAAAKKEYGTSLANVDWLHGSAESLLSVTNVLICLGLRGALRGDDNADAPKDEQPQ